MMRPRGSDATQLVASMSLVAFRASLFVQEHFDISFELGSKRFTLAAILQATCPHVCFYTFGTHL